MFLKFDVLDINSDHLEAYSFAATTSKKKYKNANTCNPQTHVYNMTPVCLPVK
jgi:hypothetical protein